jgi:hypothetical protein
MHADFFRNTRPVAVQGRYAVIEEAQLIELRDEYSHFYLYEVKENGHDSMFLRAVGLTPDTLIVFDLRTVCPDLQEISNHHNNDVPGLVLFTLRALFNSVPQAMAAMAANSLAALQRWPEMT